MGIVIFWKLLLVSLSPAPCVGPLVGHGAMAALRVVFCCLLVSRVCIYICLDPSGLVCMKRGALEPVTAASRLGAAASLAVVLFGFSNGDGRRMRGLSAGLRVLVSTRLGQHTVVTIVVELYGSLAITL